MPSYKHPRPETAALKRNSDSNHIDFQNSLETTPSSLNLSPAESQIRNPKLFDSPAIDPLPPSCHYEGYDPKENNKRIKASKAAISGLPAINTSQSAISSATKSSKKNPNTSIIPNPEAAKILPPIEKPRWRI